MGKKKTAPAPKAPDGPPAGDAEPFDMVFHCQLAHGSATRQVRDFTNVKQLYESIAKAFGIKTTDILYCTLNTHKVDMTRLLGGQIGLDDFLFAHVKGKAKQVKVSKNGPALGLTISDNGAGYAFIKKIREDSIMDKVDNCKVGDHIASLNGTDLSGCRHFEVARMLKEIAIGTEFSMELTEPQMAMNEIAPRGAQGGSGNVSAGGGKKTLRMKKDGTAVVEEVADEVTEMVKKVNFFIQKEMGIEDDELATEIYYLAKAKTDSDEFARDLDEKLADFAFPDDFVLDVHEAVHSK
eukprot:m.20297 g.20297  ORF g.20297 m.20297 type:complete len:295 (-) comp12098_c0_seq1:225-1109(-)